MTIKRERVESESQVSTIARQRGGSIWLRQRGRGLPIWVQRGGNLVMIPTYKPRRKGRRRRRRRRPGVLRV